MAAPSRARPMVIGPASVVPSADVALRDRPDHFQTLIHTRRPELLDGWYEAARASGLASLANGLAADQAAVRAAIVELWSKGPVAGQITRLKLVRRQMGGRAKPDLLRARLAAG